jgi:hypothetical protein
MSARAERVLAVYDATARSYAIAYDAMHQNAAGKAPRLGASVSHREPRMSLRRVGGDRDQVR